VAEIPNNSFEMIDHIYAAIQRKETRPFRLTRVGASGIGAECLRAIWYSWRGYANKPFDGRMMRLFRTGHLQEDRIVKDLKLAGFAVWEIDPETGEQWTHNDSTGHFVAKLDGVIKGVFGAEKTPHTLEIKTHSKKSFEEVKKFGVARAKPVHFAQMQTGMHFSDAGIRRALYVALCKDNEEYYIERVIYDETEAQRLDEKIQTIIRATMPPARISESDTFLECRWCDYAGVCKKGVKPLRTCRSCEHAEAIQGGIWMCGLLKTELTPDDQLKACEHYSEIGK